MYINVNMYNNKVFFVIKLEMREENGVQRI